MATKKKKKSAEKLTPIPRGSGARRSVNREIAQAAAAPPDVSRLTVAISPKVVRTGDLAFLADNPMEHSDESIAEMREELRVWGQLLPLVINRRPTPPRVVGGNKRLRAMLLDNWETCAVVELDLSDEQEAALAIELNSTQDTTWHKEMLAKAQQRIGSLNLGEVRDRMMTKLAETNGLVEKLKDRQPTSPATKERQRTTHTLVVIGTLGAKRAYLDISVAEARKRFAASEGESDIEETLKEFTFSDSFGVYDAWSSSGD